MGLRDLEAVAEKVVNHRQLQLLRMQPRASRYLHLSYCAHRYAPYALERSQSLGRQTAGKSQSVLLGADTWRGLHLASDPGRSEASAIGIRAEG